jgi:hypothetical protein
MMVMAALMPIRLHSRASAWAVRGENTGAITGVGCLSRAAASSDSG